MRSSEEIKNIGDIPVEFLVELDRVPLPIRQILAWESGTVIKLSRSAGENVEIFIGGARVGFGEIVVIEDMMGVRLTDFALDV